MANPLKHAKSSVKIWRGKVDDYLEIHSKLDCSKKYFPDNKVKLFYPKLSVNSEDKEIIYTLIEKLGKNLTDPQNDYLNTLLKDVIFISIYKYKTMLKLNL